MNENLLNESIIRKDIAKSLNEAVNEEPQRNRNTEGAKKWTFADWFGRDLTGETYNGDINCRYCGITSLEGAPKVINGNFVYLGDTLTSLEGAPKIVNGNFVCSCDQLTSLEGAPEEVEGDFDCSLHQYSKYVHQGKLTSLEGAPKKVGGNFNCSYNNIVSLDGIQANINGDFDCSFNKLTSLEGAPKKVGGNFSCKSNHLISLEGAPKEVGGDFDCRYCKLESISGCPKEIGGDFNCSYNQLDSIKGLGIVKGAIKCDANNQKRKILIADVSDENLENAHQKEMQNIATKIFTVIKPMKKQGMSKKEIKSLVSKMIDEMED